LGVGSGLRGRGLEEEHGRTKDWERACLDVSIRNDGDDSPLSVTGLCPLHTSVRYTPLSVTHLWSLVKVSNMNYSQEFYVLVTVHHERRVKREKPTGCN